MIGQALAFQPGRRFPGVGSREYRDLLERHGFDPFLSMPPDGQFFDIFSSQTVNSGGGVGTFASLRIGANEWLRVSAIGLVADSNSVVSIASMVFQLRLNRVPMQFYNNISDVIGTGQLPTPVLAKIFSKAALLEFFATNNDGAVNALSFGRIQGWTIPLS